MKKRWLAKVIWCVLVSVVVVSASTIISYAGDLNLKWRPIYTYDKSAITTKFSPSNNGFDLFVSKNDLRTFWFIQAISERHIELLEKNYVIKFEALSNKDFTLYSRLGEEDVTDGNSYVDHKWPIVGDGNWHTYDLEFTGRNITNFLYFQIGKALPETNLKIRNISISLL